MVREVTFEDFLQVGRTFKRLNGRVPGGQLTAEQIAETLAKFAKHEKIVMAMSEVGWTRWRTTITYRAGRTSQPAAHSRRP